ncbi:MAG: response regulator [Planctomycetes bacterium]|nr:response regulator [Planctomycetota bacterium]
MMNTKKARVLDVGQCDFDHDNIRRMVSEAFGGEINRASTGDEAFRAVQEAHFDLVLVNRVFDADGASGLDLIRRLLSNESTRATPTMLVSDYADAQDAAVALGATRGFGKNALTSSETRELLAALLDRQDQL